MEARLEGTRVYTFVLQNSPFQPFALGLHLRRLENPQEGPRGTAVCACRLARDTRSHDDSPLSDLGDVGGADRLSHCRKTM